MSDSDSKLPARASLEFLKKLAKDRLKELRKGDAYAKLSAAQLAVAREHGFASWRALKAEVDKLQAGNTKRFFEACASGNLEIVQDLVQKEPNLVRIANPDGEYAGWTGLHSAAQRGHLDVVRFLLSRGANPNAREAGDNTYPLHWAVAGRHLEIARALLDAGTDIHGIGDLHELDTIGWASYFHAPNESDEQLSDGGREILALLLERGARHHIFSAMCTGDLAVIRSVVEQNPKALERKMSRFENAQTSLHFAMNRKRYDILDLLIELGADLEATDRSGNTALEVAMLRGDREAMRRLHAAGARKPKSAAEPSFTESMAKMASSVKTATAMIEVPDVAKTLDWYQSIGFKVTGRHERDGVVNFGSLSFGKAELMLNMHGKAGEHDVALWFSTDQVDRLYQLLKSRQLEAAGAALAGEDREGIEFVEDINDTFYNAREFGIKDLNGYNLYFIQPLKRSS
jgi:ankyrin repeat protein